MEFDEVINKRRSIRKYTEKKVSDEQIFEILKAAFYSPSASNRRPWHFIIVDDEEKKQKLAKTHKWSSMVSDASVVIIVCADEEEASRWIEDASIATEHMHLKAEDMGLGSCWIAVRSEESTEKEEYVSEILGIPEKIRVLCLLPIGYPAEEKSEHDEEEIVEHRIHHGSF